MPEFWNPNALHYVIDWSAWATLVAGIAAVIGAIVVGRRQADIAARQADIAASQAKIMERQTEIAERAAETERTRLRAELYDRRVAVLTNIERYLNEASVSDGKVSNEVRDGLLQSLSVARFLLGEDVESLGRSVYKSSQMLRAHLMKEARSIDVENFSILGVRITDLYEDLDKHRIGLRSVMEKYLSLTYVDSHLEDTEDSR